MPELRPLLLRADQWALLQQIGNLLEVWTCFAKLDCILTAFKAFTQVTLQMSRARTPTSPWVIPVYEHMNNHLSKAGADTNLLPSVRTAALAGLQKLMKYHPKATECPHLILATRE
jgi:hypothetical protein